VGDFRPLRALSKRKRAELLEEAWRKLCPEPEKPKKRKGKRHRRHGHGHHHGHGDDCD
jgi:hypothetical protein